LLDDIRIALEHLHDPGPDGSEADQSHTDEISFSHYRPQLRSDPTLRAGIAGFREPPV